MVLILITIIIMIIIAIIMRMIIITITILIIIIVTIIILIIRLRTIIIVITTGMRIILIIIMIMIVILMKMIMKWRKNKQSHTILKKIFHNFLLSVQFCAFLFWNISGTEDSSDWWWHILYDGPVRALCNSCTSQIMGERCILLPLLARWNKKLDNVFFFPPLISSLLQSDLKHGDSHWWIHP